ncbi:MAG: hypothetical protein SFU83_23715 [Meiothermus sp.]|nr:hypothetical protein [Meiothermus sp.]
MSKRNPDSSDEAKAPPAPEVDMSEQATIEQHAAELGTPGWALAATKAAEGWPAQKLVSRREYESAVERTLKLPISGVAPKRAEKGGDK